MSEHFTLTAASLSDDLDVLQMLHNIGPGENGFTNTSHDLDSLAWPDYLATLEAYARGLELPEERVPQTTYWLRRDGYPVGISKVRHALNAALEARGGHIGYSLRPGERGKGYGHVLLELTLKEAYHLGLDRVLVTADWENKSSRLMIEKQGGVLEADASGSCRYWVPTSEPDGSLTPR